MSSTTGIYGQLIQDAGVHPEWQPLLQKALRAVDIHYLQDLIVDEHWLPGKASLFSAFRRDLSHCRYILFGESPYPRKESANGIAFYDAAVHELWSETGLSKAVNKATSLRNILKTALLAEGRITLEADGKIPQSSIAAVDKRTLIQSIDELFSALQQRGFLLFNATPVLHPQRKPALEATYWGEFVHQLLVQIADSRSTLPTLVLWGKIAQQLQKFAVTQRYPQLVSEHPYNLSFIHNKEIHKLFAELGILHRSPQGQAVQ
jgi:uracil-DNA glycosylase